MRPAVGKGGMRMDPREHDPAGPPMHRDGRRAKILEFAVFLFLVVPSMVISLFMVERRLAGFTIEVLSLILHNLALVSLVLFFLWRNREPIATVGLRRERLGLEIALGAALFLPITLGAATLALLLGQLGLSHGPPVFRPIEASPLHAVSAAGLVAVVAVAEEIIFRGYVMLRAWAVHPSRLFAIMVSALVFMLGHLYEGAAGAITVGAVGAALAVIYLWRGSLVAPITIHFLHNFVALVMPFLTRAN